MSSKYPIVAITGSSGAGTSWVKTAFEHIFLREGINNPVIVEGDSFHKYERGEMKVLMAESLEKGTHFSHFGPEANVMEKLEELFRDYSETGTGKTRKYIHSAEEGEPYGQEPGTFTPWEAIPDNTDLLFYEGLHGGFADGDVDAAKWVDLLVGVVPVVNLEWIQKIHRDNKERGYMAEEVVDSILRRMYDYVHFITPQFSRTDVNFQRVALVDTSNPFIARDIPTADESMVVVRFKDPDKFKVNFPYLLSMLKGSFMSRRNTIVVPGGKMGLAMEIILTPIIHQMLEARG